VAFIASGQSCRRDAIARRDVVLTRRRRASLGTPPTGDHCVGEARLPQATIVVAFASEAPTLTK
jgi:hypothetical protein